ncbi:tRNA adenosine(34) deaminase TadA [Tissierella sp. MSJ-40]|uniref:tRNA-specific adenosine deaminase n=2 Tax=Tissierella simiarum TaxID=2841534 RepID=A0ABS6E8W2_9FIRM|nr:tRNA adenosine(34) deaminase TadA [Tissierella simiarum]MBU5439370.1 tRNA adenosine(34) deaminase TadA [Tissierella simiarum]
MDEKYMKVALEEAKKAYSTYEVPVGAIIVHKNKIIGRGYNKRETLKDPTAHAEILAIKEASEYLGGWRLIDCTMYVTLEPCPMCAGAIVNSRIDKLIIGTRDLKMGCCGTVEDLTNHPKFNHRLEVIFGILEEECSNLMRDFFKELRNKK